MKREKVSMELAEFIAKEILNQADRVISSDEKLISSGLIDSFSLVDISLFVEEQFAVRIDDSELNSSVFNSLDELTELIIARNEK